MKILSIDTSSIICSVSILEDLHVLYENSLEDALTHSQNLMPMVKQALETCNFTLKEIDIFACNKGPGSFTGIRIGIATIKAFIDVHQKPGIGINSLLGLAYHLENTPYVCSMIDAKNNQVYCGLFKYTPTGYEKIELEMADDIAVILENLKKYADFPITFLGTGTVLHQEQIQHYFSNASIPKDSSFHKANSVLIGKAAFYATEKNEKKEDFLLTPLYLRKSQAERMLIEKKKKEI